MKAFIFIVFFMLSSINSHEFLKNFPQHIAEYASKHPWAALMIGYAVISSGYHIYKLEENNKKLLEDDKIKREKRCYEDKISQLLQNNQKIQAELDCKKESYEVSLINHNTLIEKMKKLNASLQVEKDQCDKEIENQKELFKENENKYAITIMQANKNAHLLASCIELFVSKNNALTDFSRQSFNYSYQDICATQMIYAAFVSKMLNCLDVENIITRYLIELEQEDPLWLFNSMIRLSWKSEKNSERIVSVNKVGNGKYYVSKRVDAGGHFFYDICRSSDDQLIRRERRTVNVCFNKKPLILYGSGAIYDIENNKDHTLTDFSGCSNFLVSPDENVLVGLKSDAFVLYNMKILDQGNLWELPYSGVYDVVFSYDSQCFAILGYDSQTNNTTMQVCRFMSDATLNGGQDIELQGKVDFVFFTDKNTQVIIKYSNSYHSYNLLEFDWNELVYSQMPELLKVGSKGTDSVDLLYKEGTPTGNLWYNVGDLSSDGHVWISYSATDKQLKVNIFNGRTCILDESHSVKDPIDSIQWSPDGNVCMVREKHDLSKETVYLYDKNGRLIKDYNITLKRPNEGVKKPLFGIENGTLHVADNLVLKVYDNQTTKIVSRANNALSLQQYLVLKKACDKERRHNKPFIIKRGTLTHDALASFDENAKNIQDKLLLAIN